MFTKDLHDHQILIYKHEYFCRQKDSLKDENMLAILHYKLHIFSFFLCWTNGVIY